MGLVAVGLAEVFVIDLLEGAVFMGFAQVTLSVFLVKDRGPQCPQVHIIPHGSRLIGLSAAVYATARTGHDLDEVHRTERHATASWRCPYRW